MSKEQQDKEIHPDWNGEPLIREGFKPIPRRSGSVAYITGNGKDGKCYGRTVETSVVDKTSEQRLQETFNLVRRLGPRVCKEFVCGGDLPNEVAMPPFPET